MSNNQEKTTINVSGKEPKFSETKSFSETKEGKEIASQLFGEDSFINNK